MKKTVDQSEFVKEFDEYNRSENFSVEGREALFDYLEQLEEDMDSEIELDIIALCCEYSEYESLEEFNNDYGKECETIDEISDYTQVINIDDTRFIIQAF